MIDLFVLVFYHSFSNKVRKRKSMDGTRETQERHNPSSMNHQTVQRSLILDRRYVKRPVARKVTSVAMESSTRMQRRQQIAAEVGRDQLRVPIRVQGVAGQGQGQGRKQINVMQDATMKSGTGDLSLGVENYNEEALRAQQKALWEQQQKLQQQQEELQRRIQLQQENEQRAKQEQQRREQMKVEAEKQQAMMNQRAARTMQLANARMAARNAAAPKHLTSQELKDRAIRQALERVASMDSCPVTESEKKMEKAAKKKHFWQKKKFVLAAAMSIVSILALGYLVKVNLPDLSVKVAALQTGIEGSYPSYLPKDFSLDGLVSEKDGKITRSFVGKEGISFTLTEERSSWDSLAVLSNFVVPNWGNDYVTVKGQGLTIYVAGSNAAWVNGGVLYKIVDETNTLTQQQLHDIAVGL